ncbi:hypothetical protein ACRN9F_09300 [Shewanella oncorhynchi]|uniref:hypothetical protein n=1 Tax=Shewanella oncorhynchi TaxID=2726434 RepID=UPI003D790ADF
MTTNTTISIPSPEVIQETAAFQDEQNIPLSWVLTMVFALVIVALILLGIYFSNFNGHWGDQGDFGTFGDFFGGTLNPILGFATVGLLILSLKLQMNELALTRIELAKTKEETALSRQAMQDQVVHLQKEAKLNELMRLMSDLRAQYRTLLSQELEGYTFRLCGLIQTHQMNDLDVVTVDRIIYKTYSVTPDQSIKDELKNAYDHSVEHNQICQFTMLEEILSLYATVVCRYSFSSNHSDISNIYLNEAKHMLQPFQEIFTSEIISEQLRKINSFYELAKKSNITT